MLLNHKAERWLWDQLVISSGVLTCQFENKDGGSILYQWVVPKKQRKEILYHLHDEPLGAHLGENKTLEKLKEILLARACS